MVQGTSDVEAASISNQVTPPTHHIALSANAAMRFGSTNELEINLDIGHWRSHKLDPIKFNVPGTILSMRAIPAIDYIEAVDQYTIMYSHHKTLEYRELDIGPILLDYETLDIGPIGLDGWKEKRYPSIEIDVGEEVIVITSDKAKRVTPTATTRAAESLSHPEPPTESPPESTQPVPAFRAILNAPKRQHHNPQ